MISFTTFPEYWARPEAVLDRHRHRRVEPVLGRFNSVARPRHLPKRGILALSRRPLMALWRFAMTGLLVPEDAVLKRI